MNSSFSYKQLNDEVASIQVFKEIMQDMQKKNAQLETDCIDLQVKVSKYKKENEMLSTEKENLAKKVGTLETAMQKLVSERNEFEMNYKRQLEIKSNEINMLLNDFNALQHENLHLKSENANLIDMNKDYEATKEQHTQLTSHYEQLYQQASDIVSGNQLLNEQCQQNAAVIAELESKLNEANIQLDQLQYSNSDLNTQKINLDLKCAELEEQVADKEKLTTELIYLRKLKLCNEDLSKVIDDLNKQLSEKNELVDELNRSKEFLAENNSQLLTNNIKIQIFLESMGLDNHQHLIETNLHVKEFDDIKVQLTKVTNELNDMKIKLKEAELSLVERDNELIKLNTILHQSQSNQSMTPIEIIRLDAETQIESGEDKNQDLIVKCQKLEEQNLKYKAKLKQLINQQPSTPQQTQNQVQTQSAESQTDFSDQQTANDEFKDDQVNNLVNVGGSLCCEELKQHTLTELRSLSDFIDAFLNESKLKFDTLKASYEILVSDKVECESRLNKLVMNLNYDLANKINLIDTLTKDNKELNELIKLKQQFEQINERKHEENSDLSKHMSDEAIAKLQSEIAHLRQLELDQREEINSLNKQIAEKLTQVKGLEEENFNLKTVQEASHSIEAKLSEFDLTNRLNELNELTTKISQLEATNAKYKAKIKQLMANNKTGSKNSNINKSDETSKQNDEEHSSRESDLKSENENLTKQIDELTLKLNEHETRNREIEETLKNENQILIEQLNNESLKIAHLNEQIAQQNLEISQLKARIDELGALINSNNVKGEENVSNEQQINNEFSELVDLSIKQMHQSQKLEENLLTHKADEYSTDQVEQLRYQLTVVANSKESLENELYASKLRISELENIIQQKEEDIQLELLQNENDSLREQLNSELAKLNAINELKTQQDLELNDLRSRFDHVTNVLPKENLKDELQLVQSENDSLKEQLNAQISKLDELEAIKSQQDAELNILKGAIKIEHQSLLQHQLNDAQFSTEASLREQLNTLSKENEILNVELNNSKSRITDLENLIQQKEEDIQLELLQNENDSLREQLNSELAKLNAINELKTQQDLELNDLRSRFDHVTNVLPKENLKDELQLVQKDNESLREHVKQLNEIKVQQEEKLGITNLKIEELERIIQQKEEDVQLELLQSENDSLKEQLNAQISKLDELEAIKLRQDAELNILKENIEQLKYLNDKGAIKIEHQSLLQHQPNDAQFSTEASLREQLNTLSKENEILNVELNNSKARVTDLENLIQQKEEDIQLELLQNENNSLSERLSNEISKLNELNELRALQDLELNNLKQQLNDSYQSQSNLHEQFSLLQNENILLKQHLDAEALNFNNLNQIKFNQDAELESLRAKLNDLQNQLSDNESSSKLNDVTNRLNEIQNENYYLKEKLNAELEQLNELNSLKRDQEAELNNLRAQLSESIAQNSQPNNDADLKAKIEENESLQAKINSLEQLSLKYKAKCKQLLKQQQQQHPLASHSSSFLMLEEQRSTSSTPTNFQLSPAHSSNPMVSTVQFQTTETQTESNETANSAPQIAPANSDELEKYKQQNLKLKAKLKQLTASNKSLEDLNKEIAQLNEQLNHLQQENEKLKLEQQDDFNCLKATYNERLTHLDETLNNNLNIFNLHLNQKENKLESMSSKLNRLVNEIINQNKLHQLEQTGDMKPKDPAVNNAYADAEVNLLNESNFLNVSQTAPSASMDQKYNHLEAQLKYCHEKCEKVVAKLNQLKSHNENINNKIKSIKSMVIV